MDNEKIGLTLCILSDHHRVQLDINNNKQQEAYKLVETEQLTIYCVTIYWVQKEIKDFQELNKNESITCTKCMGHNEGGCKKQVSTACTH